MNNKDKAQRIKEKMKELHISIFSLADQLGIKVQAVYKTFNKKHTPKECTLIRYLNALYELGFPKDFLSNIEKEEKEKQTSSIQQDNILEAILRELVDIKRLIMQIYRIY